MKSKKTILRRITTLYVVFFVVIAFGIVRTVSRFSGEDFNRGGTTPAAWWPPHGWPTAATSNSCTTCG